MGSCCSNAACGAPTDSKVRTLLWIALSVNTVIFAVEMIAGIMGGSVSLQADALDFLSDTANYGISLLVVGRALPHTGHGGADQGSLHGGLWGMGVRLDDLSGSLGRLAGGGDHGRGGICCPDRQFVGCGDAV